MEYNMNLKDIGNSFFCDQLEKFVSESPYLAFVLLSSLLEFMGNCYQKSQGSKNTTREIFFNLINNNEALKEYRRFNYKVKDQKSGIDIDNNYLYKYLRCGMLHELLPKEDIILCPDRNDLSQKVIGAKNLYEDMKRAWDELKSLSDVSSYMESTDVLIVFDAFSGSTTSSIVVKTTSQTNETEKKLEEEMNAATEA